MPADATLGDVIINDSINVQLLVEAWVYIDAGGEDGSSYGYLFLSNADFSHYFYVSVRGSGAIRVGNDTTLFTNVTAGSQTGGWFKLQITYSGGNLIGSVLKANGNWITNGGGESGTEVGAGSTGVDPATLYDRIVAWTQHSQSGKRTYVDDISYTSSAVAPTMTARTIPTGGTTVVHTASRSLSDGGGGKAGLTLASSAAAVTETYASGAASTTLTYTPSRTIEAGETITETYVQPGNGWEATDDGQDLASYAAAAVTNNSTYLAAPSSLAVTSVTSTAMNYSWTNNSLTKTGYRMEWSLTNDFAVLLGSQDLDGTTPAFSADDTTWDQPVGTTIYSRVFATRGAVVSAPSNTVSAVTVAPPEPGSSDSSMRNRGRGRIRA